MNLRGIRKTDDPVDIAWTEVIDSIALTIEYDGYSIILVGVFVK
jgi:hypothetical protein